MIDAVAIGKAKLGTVPSINSPVPAPTVNNDKLVSLWESLTNTKELNGLSQLQDKLKTAPSLSPREILLYQVQAGAVGLKVELLSKVAESFFATIRKLQSSQG